MVAVNRYGFCLELNGAAVLRAVNRYGLCLELNKSGLVRAVNRYGFVCNGIEQVICVQLPVRFCLEMKGTGWVRAVNRYALCLVLNRAGVLSAVNVTVCVWN